MLPLVAIVVPVKFNELKAVTPAPTVLPKVMAPLPALIVKACAAELPMVELNVTLLLLVVSVVAAPNVTAPV